MPPERRRAALYVLLIFLCGVLLGTVATILWMNWGPRSVLARSDSQPWSAQHVVERFTRDLNLTPDQAKQLNEILDETHKAYREQEAKIEAVRQQGRARIRAILNDEQKAKYEQILATIQRNRNQHR